MSTFSERAEALAVDVSCTDDDLSVVFSDDRMAQSGILGVSEFSQSVAAGPPSGFATPTIRPCAKDGLLERLDAHTSESQRSAPAIFTV
ncbi:MAG: hypothetical protein ACREP9_17865 [Candidatus Dormibacteraceae bacterium]